MFTFPDLGQLMNTPLIKGLDRLLPIKSWPLAWVAGGIFCASEGEGKPRGDWDGGSQTPHFLCSNPLAASPFILAAPLALSLRQKKPSATQAN